MKHLLAAAIVMVPLVASAADFAREDSARQLVEYMNARHPFDADLQSSVDMMLMQFAKTPCSEKTLPEISKLLKSTVTYERLKPAIIKSYAENYSFQELVDITTFFRSKSGALWLSKQRQQQADLQAFSKSLMDEQAASIKAVMDKHIDPATSQCKQVTP